jgi:hypothetical protein
MVSAEILPSFCVCGPWPSWYPRQRLVHEVLDRGAQAVVRGGVRCASQVLDRCVQAVARGAARCTLHVHGRGAKADACSRSFAVLSTQLSTAGLRLRQSRLGSGSFLKVSRDDAAAGGEKLVSCIAERSKYCFICSVALDLCVDLPFTSWGRW